VRHHARVLARLANPAPGACSVLCFESQREKKL
jgi:hypothetical protein